ncbi:hypothetical protein [Chitinophaga pinensis]|uniref:Trypsin-like peptidase n=1 Tax=Chitinophaga pinensis TaxID=79329 RepID=A0A5C6LM04_9BACT|nr:hypothetical protein [Chitinophaga pinensis]TWV93607.1 hypothetical protein FEF09_26950 [Chitinophaga pinensis]
MNPNELHSQQNEMLTNLESVKQSLLQIPNVIAVGIGIKESNDTFTDEIAFRVFVEDKKPLSELKPEEVVPSVIAGVKTDVLKPYVVKPRPDVCGTERRTLTKHRPLQAGIAISINSTSYGTLGWFGRLTADDSVILLTNKHVIGNTANDKVAQPKLGDVSKCCCCECGDDNAIGKVLFGVKNSTVDCAIARIDEEWTAGLNLQITNDATTEVLEVASPPTAAAVVGDVVRKIGARSGFTTGVVVHIGDAAVAGTDPAGGTISIITDQVLVIPHSTETYQVSDMSTGSQICKFAFSNNGDSGSVILNADNKIVALLYGGDETTNSVDITFANNIANVLAALTTGTFPVTLSSTDAGRRDTVKTRTITRSEPVTTDNQLEALRDANRDSVLYQLYEKHHEEVLQLINHKRPVTVVWQRNQGPAYVAALARAARETAYELPSSINDISREDLLLAMEHTLHAHGSAALKQDLLHYREAILTALSHTQNLDAIAAACKASGLIETIPSPSIPKLI